MFKRSISFFSSLPGSQMVDSIIYSKSRNFILFVIVTIFASGCVSPFVSTLSDAANARGDGLKNVYFVPEEKVWRTVYRTVKGSDLSIISYDRDSGTILAQRGLNLATPGENVAVFVRGVSDDRTEVEIVSNRTVSTAIWSPDWSKRIFSSLNNKLK